MILRVKETKIVSKPLLRTEFLVIQACLNTVAHSHVWNIGMEWLKTNDIDISNYKSERHSIHDFGSIENEVTETREATPEEYQAWLFLQMIKMYCRGGSDSYCNHPDCMFGDKCPIYTEYEIKSSKELEGKTLVVSEE